MSDQCRPGAFADASSWTTTRAVAAAPAVAEGGVTGVELRIVFLKEPVASLRERAVSHQPLLPCVLFDGAEWQRGDGPMDNVTCWNAECDADGEPPTAEQPGVLRVARCEPQHPSHHRSQRQAALRGLTVLHRMDQRDAVAGSQVRLLCETAHHQLAEPGRRTGLMR